MMKLVGSIVANNAQGLWIFRRDRDGSCLPEILADAEPILTLPDEAGGVLRVDDQGQEFGSYSASGFVVSVANDHIWPPVKVRRVPVSLGQQLPLPHGVAVALVVVGGYGSSPASQPPNSR